MQEERARKAAVRKSKMDADLDAESADLQEKKGVSQTSVFCDERYISALTTITSLPVNPLSDHYQLQFSSPFSDHYHLSKCLACYMAWQ